MEKGNESPHTKMWKRNSFIISQSSYILVGIAFHIAVLQSCNSSLLQWNIYAYTILIQSWGRKGFHRHHLRRAKSLSTACAHSTRFVLGAGCCLCKAIEVVQYSVVCSCSSNYTLWIMTRVLSHCVCKILNGAIFGKCNRTQLNIQFRTARMLLFYTLPERKANNLCRYHI